MSESDNNKKIVKNAGALYVRMLFLMIINFFATRVILQALGVEDYGIYNVVGGVVALFSVVSQALSSACSRFLTYEIGKGNYSKLKHVFSTSVTIHIFLAILVAILAEAIGLWFLYNKMVIPSSRILAALWVFQFSILTFCINLISIPYNAAIIAHEKMTAFAYIGIFEGVAKLLICYIVMISTIDKLIVYAGLLCAIQVFVRFMYTRYCKRNFQECHYEFSYDKQLSKDIFSFSGWNFIGATSVILRTQGSSVLINLFAGPAVNAALGVANQVNRAISMFSGNFLIAVKPQITKNYAVGNIEYMTSLVIHSSRLSYYMLLILALPIVINIDFILSHWLTVIPEKTALFLTLTIIFTMVEILSDPLITVQMATGKVRNYQLLVGGLNLLNLPISYTLLKLGLQTEVFLYVMIGLSFICLFARLYMLKTNIGFAIDCFVRNVIIKVFFVTLISFALPLFVSTMLPNNAICFILKMLFSVIWTIAIVYFAGCSIEEKNLVKNTLNKIQTKIKR